MKRVLLFIAAIILLSSIGLPQSITKMIEKSDKQILMQKNNPPLICGTPSAYELDKEVLQFFIDHPELKTQLKKPAKGWGFEIGDTHNWWTVNWNSEPTSDYEVPSTCRGKGDNCYVFVANSIWHDGGVNPQVTQDHVDDIVEHFNNTTANFPTMGIYDVDVETFGDPPDFDGDQRIVILILEINQDNVGGYFTSLNQSSDSDAQTFNRRSNEAEMYYMDVSGVDNVEYSRRLQAHEFQHMIHYNYDINEVTFVNEGMSMIAEYVCGYSETYYFNAYQQNTNEYLFYWGEPGTSNSLNYARAALWTLYIHEQFPDGILKKIVQNTGNKNAGLDAAMNQIGSNRRYRDTFADWLVANYLQDKTVVPEYGYDYSPIAKPQATTHYITTATGGGTLKKIAAEYITFASGTPFKITFTGHSTLHIKAIKTGPSGSVIESVTRGEEYDVPDFGTTYTEVTFVVYRDSEFDTGVQSYSYVAIGSGGGPVSVELVYEEEIPSNGSVLSLNTGDSLAVYFDGVEGFKIDSVKIAFQQNGMIPIYINEYNTIVYGSSNSPLGIPLVPTNLYNINLSSTPGWYTIDLSSQNISATNDFIVGVILGNDFGVPGILAAAENISGSNHTWMYSSVNFGNGWYNSIGVSGQTGFSWKYMIRAYVSMGGGNVAIDQSGIVTIPAEFSLEQNYPNPFNPSTTFRFSTPEDGLIKFTVHDLLGRVIYSENRNLLAGNYSFTWNGQNQLDQQVVSGVYFLWMEAEGFSQTRKMLLLR